MLLILALIWALAHRYTGLTQDGELYAMQALSRIETGLRSDLYLANTSQDQYTYFSPLYAYLIRYIGLWNAGVALFLACRVVFYTAAWFLVRQLSDSRQACFSTALLIVAVGEYGAYGVFRFAESYLTARSMAEALVVLSLALAVAGRFAAAWLFIALSFAMHPLMTLPGALLLLCLPMQHRRAVSLAGTALCLAGVTTIAVSKLDLGGALQRIDGQWLEVVRQRSQFLFVNEWLLSDWMTHIRSILCLSLTYLVLQSPTIRRLCVTAGIVGASGIILAWVAGSIGPVAILLQSQPWRWFWVTSFTSVVLLGPLAAALWKHGSIGRTCAVLVVVGWVFPTANGALMEAGALAFWIARRQLGQPTQRIVGATWYLVVGAVAVWTLATGWSGLTAPLAENLDRSVVVGHVRAIFQLQTVPVFLVLCSLWWVRWFATKGASLVLGAIAATLLVIALPGALSQRDGYGTAREKQSFDDWRSAIPGRSTVLAVPTTIGSMFEWFTLERPSYLSLDQSAGVVFSRATAAEVARRADVLRPVTEPEYEIKRRLQLKLKREDLRHPLTDQTLRQICSDSALGFVIAHENLGYSSLVHLAPGAYNGSHLYDCGQIRQTVSP